MSKRLILILALAFVVGIAFTAYAEVQNVKVSGDITVKGVARDNLDLVKAPASGSTVGTAVFNDQDSDFLSISRVRIDADLTDNVSTTVRLLNERNWNGESGTADQANRNIGFTANNTTEENDIDLDLAYVTLKEFLYSPLSLSIGRQELRFGNGLIVGDPDTNIYSVSTNLAEGDLSARKSFDAIRATLDYNPLVLDAIYAKVEEGANNLNDDVTLAGINASYALDKNTTLEGYFFSKVKGSNAAAVTNYDTNAASYTVTTLEALNALNKQSSDKVNTLGARVVNNAIKNLAVDLQGAYQFGTYNPKFDTNAHYINATDKRETAGRKAWAVQVEATYDLKDVLAKYSPVLALNYTALSGADREVIGNADYKGWDPVFEDQTYGHLLNAIMANTNMHRLTLSGKAKLTDDLAMKLDYTGAWLQKKYLEGRETVLSGVATTTATGRSFRMGDKKYLGQEIDAALVYDYTEDVQLSLLGGIFIPGKNINDGTSLSTGIARSGKADRASAVELIGSMKVTF